MRKREISSKTNSQFNHLHACLVTRLKHVLILLAIAVLHGRQSGLLEEMYAHLCKWTVNHTTLAMLNISLIATINQQYAPQVHALATKSVLQVNAALSCLHLWSNMGIQILQTIKLYQTTIHHLTTASITVVQVCKHGLVGAIIVIFHLMLK